MTSDKQIIGILGGMGPLASAEFLKTIYQFNIEGLEQQSPTCILYSDPTVPDRSEAIRSGQDEPLLGIIANSLERLFQMGCTKVIVCCITSHHFLEKLPADLRKQVISLVDVIIDEVAHSDRRHLLLCTNGSRLSRVFERHARWPSVSSRILLPDEEDQQTVHGLIYRIKANASVDSVSDTLTPFMNKYEVNSFIAGCTEIHLLAKRLLRANSDHAYTILDPLMVLARELRRFIDAQ